jgi:8-oxo-dGTP pyrophosphatase MutT (NUDIX family)
MHSRSVQILVNTHFSEKLELIGFYQKDASIEMVGEILITPDLRKASAIQLSRLQLSTNPNEAHAIVTDYKNSPDESLHLQLQTLDFSNICAMRAAGQQPAILSASAILLCPDTEELIVHQRSAKVATHPSHWHIFGGAFNPTLDISSKLASLRLTLQRELHEETGLQLSIPPHAMMALTKEKATGFVQWCVLGVPVEVNQLAQLHGNWEGSIHRVSFNQLSEFLQEPNWVASGKAHILSWLALGAPQTKPDQKFGTYTPLQLFEKLIKLHK